MKSFLVLPVVGMFMVSCAGEKWPEKSEIEFTNSCASSYVQSFESTMGDMMSEVNEEKLDKLSKNQCSCIYESLKKNYDSAEAAFKVGFDELMESSNGCDPTDEQINDLLVK